MLLSAQPWVLVGGVGHMGAPQAGRPPGPGCRLDPPQLSQWVFVSSQGGTPQSRDPLPSLGAHLAPSLSATPGCLQEPLSPRWALGWGQTFPSISCAGARG